MTKRVGESTETAPGVVVVLGMHRSGTSAMTRALRVIGVDLGENFIATLPGVNEKGFWEDADVNRINIEVLRRLGMDWFHWRELDARLFAGPGVDALLEQARTLIAQRLQQAGSFGFKDPRTVRLLPFWQKVFADLSIQPRYLIAIRNPLSVAESLARRNGFDPVKSHFMWLQHVLPGVLGTAGASRLVVDFDLFLREPRVQLARMAERLGTQPPVAEAVDAFVERFLDRGLRHASHGVDDLTGDPAIPPDVAETYRILLDVALDRRALEAPEIQAHFAGLRDRMVGLAPLFGYLDRIEDRLARCENRPSAAVPVADVVTVKTGRTVLRRLIAALRRD